MAGRRSHAGRRSRADPQGDSAAAVQRCLDSAQLTRRALLKYGSLLGALGFVEVRGRGLLSAARAAAQSRDAVVTAYVTRADDMLSLRFEFINFTLLGDPARLVRSDLDTSSFVVVHFEPQAIAEQAFSEAEPPFDETLPTPPIKARLATPSRLGFLVPGTIDEIPFNLDNLLNWDQFFPSLPNPAQVPPEGEPFLRRIHEPLPTQTAIEAPWRLVLAPRQGHEWNHVRAPVVHEGRSELWHTRLASSSRAVVGQPPPKPQLHAVWTPGFKRNDPPGTDPKPFLMSLNANDRHQLVRLTSDYRISKFTPKPVPADLFMLSALGAWMDVKQDWSYSDQLPLSVIHWSHRATMGRDHFVKIIRKGFLYPFGHRAVKITITERKFQPIEAGAQKGKIGAFLRRREFIVVKEPEKSYSTRDMPFKNIRMKTLITPNLNPPFNDSKSRIFQGDKIFWPRVGDGDFLFHLVATDWEGQESEFTAPLPWVDNEVANNPTALGTLVANYLATNAKGRRTRDMFGQKVAFAAASPDRLGDTTLEVKNLEFSGHLKNSGTPRWRPVLASAQVRLQAIEQVKGTALDLPTVEYHPAYVEEGFGGANAASQVFVRLRKPVSLDYGASSNADRSGGMVTPNMNIAGLSRKTGPMGGDLLSDKSLPSAFNPAKFFEGASILGGIDLADILKVAGFDQAPELLNRNIYPNNDSSRPPEKIVTSLTWSLNADELKGDPLQLFEPLGNASLDVNATFTTPIDPPGEPTYEIVGQLRNFKVHMIGKPSAFLIITFSQLTFTSKTGQSPDVDVDISKVEFAGILTFVNELKDFMNFGGSGLSIDVAPSQIEVSYTLEIPTISVGIFSLQNISLGAGVIIPFTGDPVKARFNFCRPDAQFLLTYTIFGGGGFVQLTVGADKKGDFGIELFEVGLEFGANASIDIGVASGGVHIMAGIYFAIGTTECDGEEQPVAQLSGYVRLGGELDILGIISLSLEFRMGLTYDFIKDEVWGQATLVVEVEVLFFSASVELTVEKKFGGSGKGGGGSLCSPAGAPLAALQPPAEPVTPVTATPITFTDIFTETEWQEEYVAAFAPAAFAGSGRRP